MSWVGFGVFVVTALGAFALCWRSSRSCTERDRGLPAVLLAVLVGTVVLRYRPELEARLFPDELYAHLRPWWSVVCALAFLGAAAPRLAERRKRVAVTGLAAVLFVLVAERAGASAALAPSAFTGRPHPDSGTCPQSTGFSCGAAASVTFLARLGVESTEAEMVERCLTNRLLGTGEFGLLKGLREKLGETEHEVRVEQLSATELDSLPLPALAVQELDLLVGHWVVLVGVDAHTVTIADPLRASESHPHAGLRTLSREAFAEDFGGIVVRLVRP